MLEELLEQEVTDFLGKGYYEQAKAEEAKSKGYRNGYEPLRVATS